MHHLPSKTRDVKRRWVSSDNALCLCSGLMIGMVAWNGLIARSHIGMFAAFGSQQSPLGAASLDNNRQSTERSLAAFSSPLLKTSSSPQKDFAAAISLSQTNKHRRRSKLHLCPAKGTVYGREILAQSFNFDVIDASYSSDWDIIYGGYHGCGDPGHSDWDMEEGLNKVMKERGDWKNLKPHQVFHPCMGCRDSYCNKKHLCSYLRDIDPTSCYLLPEDTDLLKQAMINSTMTRLNRDGSIFDTNKTITPFVMKSSKRHGGRGVRFIWHAGHVPLPRDSNDSEYIVQNWMEPHLYSGMFQRKSELRIHVAITSIVPLRAYYHVDHAITFAAKKYTNTIDALTDRCMSDTSSSHDCDDTMEKEFFDFLASVPNLGRQILFDDYVKASNMSEADRSLLLERAFRLISQIMVAGNPTFESHPNNQGIHAGGAMCFSHMRFDLGIGKNLEPFIYEVCEIPSKNSPGNLSRVLADDLFHLVGLAEPVVPVKERAAFELAHLGGWRPLPGLSGG